MALFCIIITSFVLLKFYFVLVIYAFSCELADRIHPKIVIGEPEQIQIGIAIKSEDSVCKDVPIGVLFDASDEEKDAASMRN